MSRPAPIEDINVCAPSSSVTVEWGRFIDQEVPSPAVKSPVDEYYEANSSLVKLFPLTEDEGLSDDAARQLSRQLVLGFVSAVEMYLRAVTARTVRACPWIRRLNRDQMLPYGALSYYDAEGIERALLERASFSEAGTIKRQLEARLDVKVAAHTPLSKSIADFERLCQLRHALVHSHGQLSSANAADFLEQDGLTSCQAVVDLQCLQWVAAISVNLVRDVNAEISRSVLWRWVREAHMIPGSDEFEERLSIFEGIFLSEMDAAKSNADTVDDVRATAAQVARIISIGGAAGSGARAR